MQSIAAMRMAVFVLLCLSFGAIQTVNAAKPAESMDVRAALQVDVDATGTVASAQLVPKDAARLPAAIADPLLADARSWRFEPATRDGTPVASSTHVRLTLRFEPLDADGEAWTLRIVRASNGPLVTRSTPPAYPKAAIHARAAARVTVDVDIAADGAVLDSRVVEVDIAPRHRRHADTFAESTLESTRTWRYIPEQVAGEPVASTVREITTYCINDPDCYRPDDPAAPVDGESIAEAPVTRPLTDLVGRTL